MKKNLLIIFIALFISTAWAQKTDFYFFADAAIGMFSDIRDAEFSPNPGATEDGKAILESVLKNTARKNQLYAKVIYHLKQFDNQDRVEIQRAVAILSSGILLLQSANGNSKSYMEKVLSDPKLLLQQGVFSRRMAELSEASNSAWMTYAQTAGLVTYPLIDGFSSTLKDKDPEKMQKELTKLLITEKEVELLKSHLQESFGPVLADNRKAGFVDMPAISMWRFLNDKWTPAAE